MEKTLYIVRGIPGSGKSTLAKTLGGVHLEADMYFLDSDGNYNFDVLKLKDAHEWCRKSVKKYMEEDQYRIVVSNTFTQQWEMDPYITLAKEHGYKTFYIISENRHEGKNIHDVPQDILDKMKERFEVIL